MIRIKKGLDIPIQGVPEQVVEDARPVGSVALVAPDFIGLKPNMMVAVGDRVRLGQPLFFDKRNPEVLFTSPGCGEVVAIERGARRALRSVVVNLNGDDEETFKACKSASLVSLDRTEVQQNLLASGLWVSLRTRPFSKIPAPGTAPDAIFVTAMDTNPLAANPASIIAESSGDFGDGLKVLSRLTDGNVHVCQAPGPELAIPDIASLTRTVFDGPHPAGLPGTHMHFLYPVSDHRMAWYLNYQDVIAMGRLFTSGRLPTERVIALGGPAVLWPRLLRTRLGACTRDLLTGELGGAECRIVSGSILSGRRAAGWARYLGRYHLQLSVLLEGREREFLGWLTPGFKKYSAINAFAASLLPRQDFPLTTSQHGSPRAMVPIGNFERVMPLDILPAPLLKALLVRDTDTARALGCLELDEEDLALCSFVCCSKYEYGPELRDNLDMIERDG